MVELWKKLFDLEKEAPHKSREPSLKATEESAAPEREEAVCKSSMSRLETAEESPRKVVDHEEESKPPTALVADLANRIRKTVTEIRDLTESSRDKFKDPVFGREFQRRITDCIDNSESDLDCFLDYLRIKSRIRRANMIHVILEEALEKHKKKLMDKGIRILEKRSEKGLPDAGVHIEELRFILNWVLEYVIISALPNQGLAFLTRSLEAQEGSESIGFLRRRGTKCVEIVIASGNCEDFKRQAGVPPKTDVGHIESGQSWILPLVEEIVQKNGGTLKLSERRLRMVSLILPIERRKMVYHELVLDEDSESKEQ